jgi:transcriptional regulator with XRE-family HTH domain
VKEPTRKPTDVDKVIGLNIRRNRIDAGITQVEVAEALGMSYQMIQRYEQGKARVPAEKIVSLSIALAADVASFFDGVDTNVAPLKTTKEAIKVRDEVSKIEDPRQLRAILELVRSMVPVSV